ncbi:hypothetical protein GCM10023339_20300 [Alloalcanivorax gelatiniphagus]
MESDLVGYVRCFNYMCISRLRAIGTVPICLSFNRRYYSTSSSPPQSPGSYETPQPILTLDLDDQPSLIQYESLLRGKGGIYSLVNTVSGKRYIGSAKDFYIRLNEHLRYKNNTNVALQKAFVKYGYGKFKICIYEYFTYESKIMSHKSLTELETSYIAKFPFDTLYNFSSLAHNNLGYKRSPYALRSEGKR